MTIGLIAHPAPNTQGGKKTEHTKIDLLGNNCGFKKGFLKQNTAKIVSLLMFICSWFFVSLLTLYDMDPWNSEIFATYIHLKMTPGPLNYIQPFIRLSPK